MYVISLICDLAVAVWSIIPLFLLKAFVVVFFFNILSFFVFFMTLFSNIKRCLVMVKDKTIKTLTKQAKTKSFFLWESAITVLKLSS